MDDGKKNPTREEVYKLFNDMMVLFSKGEIGEIEEIVKKISDILDQNLELITPKDLIIFYSVLEEIKNFKKEEDRIVLKINKIEEEMIKKTSQILDSKPSKEIIKIKKKKLKTKKKIFSSPLASWIERNKNDLYPSEEKKKKLCKKAKITIGELNAWFSEARKTKRGEKK